MMNKIRIPSILLLLVLPLLALSLQGCVEMAVVGAGAAAMSAVDRRTTGGVRKVVKVFEYCKPADAICAPSKAKAEEPKKSGS